MQKEVIRQLDAYRELVGRSPTHIDSHQHVHRDEPVRSILRDLATNLHVPLRSFDPQVHHCGSFYGQTGDGEPYPEGISAEAFLNILDLLPEGVTEVGCHPGADENLDSVYRLERLDEMKVLCDPKMRQAVAKKDIELCSFAELPQMKGRAV